MAELMKDEIGKAFLSELATAIRRVFPEFSSKRFLSQTVGGASWSSYELKQRIRVVATALGENLPSDFKVAISVLRDASVGFSGLRALVFPDFVEVYGLKHWRVSMSALATFTELSSSEFGIRPYIELDPAKAFRQLARWSRSPNEHLRRLASEGCRPFLPWAKQIEFLNRNREPILQILDTLKADESLYVRKSVANNLNDLSKLWPQRVLAVATAWYGKDPKTDWIVKHGLRTLLKSAEPEALALFGYRDPESYELEAFSLENDQVKIGGELGFRFVLKSKEGPLGKLRIEYIVSYMKANGSQSEKVYKVGESTYGESRKTWVARRGFKDLSTRKHHPGTHSLAVVANGKRLAWKDFLVTR